MRMKISKKKEKPIPEQRKQTQQAVRHSTIHYRGSGGDGGIVLAVRPLRNARVT